RKAKPAPPAASSRTAATRSPTPRPRLPASPPPGPLTILVPPAPAGRRRGGGGGGPPPAAPRASPAGPRAPRTVGGGTIAVRPGAGVDCGAGPRRTSDPRIIAESWRPASAPGGGPTIAVAFAPPRAVAPGGGAMNVSSGRPV